MTKQFKVAIPVLAVLAVIVYFWGPGMTQSRKMEEAKLWIEDNRSEISNISNGDELDLSVSTALYIKVSGKVRDKERMDELKEQFQKLKSPLPFKYLLSVKPKVELPTRADFIFIKVHSKMKKIAEVEVVNKLLKILNNNKGGNDHKCMDNGYIVLVRGEAKTKLELVPSHGDKFIEFRFNGKLYLVDKEEFFSIEELSDFKKIVSETFDKSIEK